MQNYKSSLGAIRQSVQPAGGSAPMVFQLAPPSSSPPPRTPQPGKPSSAPAPTRFNIQRSPFVTGSGPSSPEQPGAEDFEKEVEQVRPRSGFCATRGFSESRPAVVQRLAENKPITTNVNISTGETEAVDQYSQGVIQGLQRSLGAFIPGITSDGVISDQTVVDVVSVLEQIGLPPGMEFMPTTVEDITSNARIIAQHIANAAGVEANFIPGEPQVVSEEVLVQGAEKAPDVSGLFSRKNLTIGAMLFGGFVLLNR